MGIRNHTEFFSELTNVYPELSRYEHKFFSIPFDNPMYSNAFSYDDLRSTILEQVNNNKKILFHARYETFQPAMFNIIQNVIDSLPIKENTYFSTIGCADYQEAYEKFKQTRNIKNKLIFIAYNYWEHWAASTHKNKKHLQDSEYEVKIKEKNFLCFNRTERIHRFYLYAHSIKHNWFDNSFYSFMGTHSNFVPEFILMAKNHLVSHATHPLLNSWMIDVIENTKKNFPILIKENQGRKKVSENIHIEVNTTDSYLFDNSYVSVVTETLFGEDTKSPLSRYNYLGGYKFLTEKTFKPIIAKHPFILVSYYGNLKYLKSLGYKTFHPYIDETYDEIKDDDLRMEYITNEILRLNSFSDSDWLLFQKNIKDIVEYNHNHILNTKTDFRITKIDSRWFE